MDDLISRQEAIDAIVHKLCIKSTDFLLPEEERIIDTIRNMPSAQPEWKTGKWINHRNDDGHNIADCDQCGEAMQWFDDDIKPHFCPNCGAKMEGEQE